MRNVFIQTTPKILFAALSLLFVTGCTLQAKITDLGSSQTLAVSSKVTFTTNLSSSPAAGSYKVTATFPTSVTGVTLSDFIVSNGVASNLSGSGNVYTFTVTPTSQGPVECTVVEGKFKDSSNNTITSTPSTIYYDLSAVTISLTNYQKSAALGSSTGYFEFSLSTTKPYDIVIDYEIFGTADYGTDHNLKNGQVTVKANTTSVQLPYTLYRTSQTSLKTLGLRIVKTPSSTVQMNSGLYSTLYLFDTNLTSYSDVSSRLDHVCAIVTATGQVRCWGNNTYGQLGIGNTNTQVDPVEPDSGVSYQKISTSDESVNNHGFTCGIRSSGALYCWGRNNAYQLGDTSTTDRYVPTLIDSGVSYSQVSAGGAHACGITTAGLIKCWGNNVDGQLGDTTTTNRSAPVPVDAGTTYSVISAGVNNTCAITTAGALKCWGNGPSNTNGNNSTSDQTSPVTIDSGTSYTQVSVGFKHACGITTSGILKCWGNDGVVTNYPTPTVFDSGTSYSKVSVHSDSSSVHTCGLTTAGALKCSTNLGSMNVIDSDSNYTHLSINNSGKLCTLSSSVAMTGMLRCIGTAFNLTSVLSPTLLDNYTVSTLPTKLNSRFSRILSDGSVATSAGTSGSSSAKITSEYTYTAVTSDSAGSYMVTSSGALEYYANNSATPSSPDSGTLYTTISSGYNHTCGITTAGGLRCWGTNTNGQLGNNSTTTSATPIDIDAGNTYTTVSAGYSYTCAIRTGGALYCWGLNGNGQLGDNSTTQRLVPTLINSGTSYSKVFTSNGNAPGFGYIYPHTCGITAAGALHCWGANNISQLGDNTTTQRLIPTLIDSGNSYQSVSVSGDWSNGFGTTAPGYTCGVLTSGVLKCWGRNTNGTLGTANLTSYATPQTIDSGVTYTSVVAGIYYACGLTTTNSVKCWGDILEKYFDSSKPTFVTK